MVCTQEIPRDRFFKKRSGRSKWGTSHYYEFYATARKSKSA